MRTTSDIAGRVSAYAPLLVLSLLIVLPILLPNMTRFDPGSEQRKVQLQEAMTAVPYFIGDWVGADEIIPREAQRLLKPNATLSRTYQQTVGVGVHVVVVHCGDARDMIGHYPPICYPSSGWVRVDPAGATDIEFDVMGEPLPVRLYRFRRLREQGETDQIRIFNAFVLPDGTVTREIDDINRQSERLAVSVQGVAQLQLITSVGLSLEEALSAASELLEGMPELLQALRVGEGAGRDT